MDSTGCYASLLSRSYHASRPCSKVRQWAATQAHNHTEMPLSPRSRRVLQLDINVPNSPYKCIPHGLQSSQLVRFRIRLLHLALQNVANASWRWEAIQRCRLRSVAVDLTAFQGSPCIALILLLRLQKHRSR